MDSDTWEIIHIPDKPTFSPEHQPTCMLLSISLRMVSHFGFVFLLKVLSFQSFFCLCVLLFTVKVFASVIKPKFANTIVRFVITCFNSDE